VLRLEDLSVRELADVVADSHQRDEMAAPSYLHRNPLIRWLFWQRLELAWQLLGKGPDWRGLDFGCGSACSCPRCTCRPSECTRLTSSSRRRAR
jgi:hypothetical protein